MELKRALKGQYHGALGMLRQAIEKCPDELWASRDHPRDFWRIAYHTLFYAHLYMQKSEAEFVAWELHRDDNSNLWEGWEPGAGPIPYTKEELLQYWTWVNESVDETVESLDLDAQEPGFHWYTMPKLDHQIMNIRHIQQHAGQLSELLMAEGIDTDWMGMR